MALRPWREVVHPHPDVASGRFRQAEFAADLAQVLKGEATGEYQDAVEFFRRTYLTEGMRQLLSTALLRLSRGEGDPVVQLKTAFGGGKTHTLLALYHLLSRDERVDQLDVTRSLLDDAGLGERPRAATAVLVGTDLDANRGRDVDDLATTIFTLWGYLAYQLGQASRIGTAAAWRFVDENDASAVAPGGETLKRLFDAVGPCVILIDEFVAYVRNLRGARARGGTFDSNLTFIQNLTEAVKATPNAMLVASLPESKVEVGGTAGEEALQRVEHLFRRVQAAAYPVAARESFEIVRRRLFDDVGDAAARDEACAAFDRLYRQHANDFPTRVRDPDYERRLGASYPIHPEIFDQLYDEWSVNERFQRTRGVLRLMAAAIHGLWRAQDPGLLIMPGSLPVVEPAVRNELLTYLGEGWNAVIDSDVDSDHAEPARIDDENPRFGQHRAATRVARTILLGSPEWKSTKGLDTSEVLLGVVEPGHGIAEYNDALGRLRDRLAFLYTTGTGRYWFAAQPNLKRTVTERANRISEDDALMELERRLKESKERGAFAGVHVCPSDSGDVGDEDVVRLVVISPRHPHTKEGSRALAFAAEVLDRRGTRRRKNMLVFAAADGDEVLTLVEDARRWKAWKSVADDADALNLDRTQRHEVASELDKASKDLSARLDPAYQWLVVPEQEGTAPIQWRVTKFASNHLEGVGALPIRAANSLGREELLLTKWSPAGLHLELQRYVWGNERDEIKIKELWEYFATYLYLPRLRDSNVLLEAIKDGTAARDYFGYATSKTPDGKYAGLAFGRRASNVFLDDLGIVVRADVAAAAIAEVEGPPKEGEQAHRQPRERTDIQPPEVRESGPRPPTRFYGRIRLNPQRLASSSGQVGDEVIQHLLGLVGAEVEVDLDIEIKVREGIPDRIVRTVSENAATLKFEHFGFEEE